MAPKGTWDTTAERDLVLAGWYSASGGECKADWSKTHDLMTQLGHSFSRDALNQRWSKKIHKDFKERLTESTVGSSGNARAAPKRATGGGGSGTGTGTGAGAGAATTTGASTTKTRKRSRAVTFKTEPGTTSNDESEAPPPAKKQKQGKSQAAKPKRKAAPTSFVNSGGEDFGDDEFDGTDGGRVDDSADRDGDFAKEDDEDDDEEDGEEDEE